MGYNPWAAESDTTERLTDTHTQAHVYIIVRGQSLTALLPRVWVLSAVFEGTEERVVKMKG